MKFLLSLAFYITPCVISFAQNVERKIIIENNSFFYTTIHDEFQIGTLNVGNLATPLKASRKLALPAGRNYDDPVNPFSWDIIDSSMYAISFLNHPLNNKDEALKCFKLSSLREWSDEVTIMEMIMKSVEQNRFAYNDPYKFMIHQSTYINGFFFDGIVAHDSSYIMVIANNNQLSIWTYDSDQWTHSKMQAFRIDGFFTLFELNKQLYIVLNNGNVHKASKELVQLNPAFVTNKSLKEYALVLNRDKNSVEFIKYDQLITQQPFNELVHKKGIPVF